MDRRTIQRLAAISTEIQKIGHEVGTGVPSSATLSGLSIRMEGYAILLEHYAELERQNKK